MVLFIVIGTAMYALFKINDYGWSCLLLPKIRSAVDVFPFVSQQVPCPELSWRIPLQFFCFLSWQPLGVPRVPPWRNPGWGKREWC